MSAGIFKLNGAAQIGSLATAPSSPVNGDFYYDTVSNSFQFYQNGTWTSISGGGGGGSAASAIPSINFIGLTTAFAPTNTNDVNAETNIGNWIVYQDTAGSVPVNMNGTVVDGSPITLTRTTTSGQVLDGTGSFLITKPAANKQGEGVSVIANIPPAFRTSQVNVVVPYKVLSGTVSSGDISVFAYDVTNSIILIPASNKVGSVQGIIQSSFNIQSTTAQIRFGFHFASTAAGAITMSFDDVFVGYSTTPVGVTTTSAVNDGPMTIKGSTSDPSKGTTVVDQVIWRRVGQYAYIKWDYQATTGSGNGGSGDYRFVLPAGLIADTSVLPAFNGVIGDAQTNAGFDQSYCGTGFLSAIGQARGFASVFLATNNSVSVVGTNSFSGLSAISSSFFAITTGSYSISIEAWIPIVGWAPNFNLLSSSQTTMVGSDWISYPLLVGGSISAPSLGTTTVNSAVWRRVGDSMEIKYDLNQTSAGSSGSGTYLLPIPAGYSIDFTKFKGSTNLLGQNMVGSGDFFIGSTGAQADVLIFDSSNLYVVGNNGQNTLSSGAFSLTNSPYQLSVNAKIPIVGWTATQSVPTIPINGIAGSDWQFYPMQITANSGGNPTLGTNTNFSSWRRVGDSMEIKVDFNQTSAGSAGSGTYRFSIPVGYSIDTNKFPGGVNSIGQNMVGYGDLFIGSTGAQLDVLMFDNNNLFLIASNGSNTISSGAFSLGNSPFRVSFTARIPIAGWSSNVSMTSSSVFRISSQLTTRVTTAPTALGQYRSYQKGSSSAAGSDTAPGALPSVLNGLAIGAFNFSTAGSGTSNISRYEIFIGSNMNYRLEAYSASNFAGGVSTSSQGYGLASQSGLQVEYDNTTGILTVDCMPGSSSVTSNNIGTQAGSAGAASSAIASGFFDVIVAQNALLVGASGNPNARYFSSSTSLSGSLATVTYATKDYDSAGAGYSSGVYTATVAGKYSIKASLLIAGTVALNNTVIMEIQKNGTVVARRTKYFAASQTDADIQCDDTINCVAGDQIRIQVSTSITGPSIVSSNFDNFLSIAMVSV